ncbi:hypothetical protein, variant [Aphanomyces astaci]|uniref:Uncharacterized protein n=1 Tax=Aphanomyces astaci TaxID=112090 RepID=W4FH58_APHAT|nr:hypothetical protein, variant [Aphanomyces astaci]ETV66151.1 hypothetical protein, variant [Aphanomyces astaci]|eukprot:XP_009844340.1 hypothetical protein, variant [Aphanomyces astaci]
MASESKPSLRTMALNVQTCLDEMLPDHFRNASSGSFQQHLVAQREKVPAQKATWKGGLNYLFESLKMHREWYGRNQQYVQLKKEEKRLEAHVVTLRSIISSSLSTLELEVGLREAELKGRVGAYKVMFEVSRVASALSRPAVKLHVHKPNDSSISVFCDTFVLDIHLTGGNGDVESASLTTVVNEVTKQYPERDADLLSCLLELISGRSERFTEKLRRLVNRAELAAKFPSTNFDELEDDLHENLQLVCAKQNQWTVKRGVDGLLLTFRDGLQCFPVPDPDASSEAWPEWRGCLTFAEWKGAVALHFLCDTALVMSAIQCRRLASLIFGMDDQDAALNELMHDSHAVVRIQPHVRSVAHASTNVMLQRVLPMVLEGTLVTKDILGGLRFDAFPIPLLRGTGEVLGQLLAVVGHSLFFHSILASFFASATNIFGRKDAVNPDVVPSKGTDRPSSSRYIYFSSPSASGNICADHDHTQTIK